MRPMMLMLLLCSLSRVASAADDDSKADSSVVQAAASALQPLSTLPVVLPTAKWTGQFQTDSVAFVQDEASRARYSLFPNGAAFRRARIGLFGEYGAMDYRIEVDFALPGRPSFLDVYLRVVDVPYLGRVRVGHFFEPYSLERITANRFVTFLERTSIDQAFVPARNLGVMASNNDAEERVSTAVGLFRQDSDRFGDAAGNRFESALTGRVTGLPYYEADGERLLHLGLGYSFRGPNDGRVQFRAQPELRLGSTNPNVPFLVDTGFIAADFYQLIGPEVAAVWGPVSFQSEASVVPVRGRNRDYLFYGWYAELACFLTGEHRLYLKNNGTFGRVTPKADFFGANKSGGITGPGAVQVAFRISQLDLTNENIRGGRLTELTGGANWHLNAFTRIQANYVLARTDRQARGEPTVSHGFGLRLGFEF